MFQLEGMAKKNSDADVKNSELSVKLSILEQMRETEPNKDEKVRISYFYLPFWALGWKGHFKNSH